MGNKTSQVKISFEDVQQRLAMTQDTYIMINTLPNNMQSCLIPNTVESHKEESVINGLLKHNADKEIIIYGLNNNDESVIRKYKQLLNLGFQNIYIYLGGVFEWLLLQDIYGTDNFPTTSRDLDIMKYKPRKNISY